MFIVLFIQLNQLWDWSPGSAWTNLPCSTHLPEEAVRESNLMWKGSRGQKVILNNTNIYDINIYNINIKSRRSSGKWIQSFGHLMASSSLAGHVWLTGAAKKPLCALSILLPDQPWAAPHCTASGWFWGGPALPKAALVSQQWRQALDTLVNQCITLPLAFTNYKKGTATPGWSTRASRVTAAQATVKEIQLPLGHCWWPRTP